MAKIKYALIKDGNCIQYRMFEEDEQPALTENKGEWRKVQADLIPTYDPETEVLVSTGKKWYGNWKIEHTIRDKTALELWKHPEYSMKITLPSAKVPNYAALAVFLMAQKLPIYMDKSANTEVYLNEILPEHEPIIANDPDINVENKPIT